MAITGDLIKIKQEARTLRKLISLPSGISSDYSFVTTDIQNECKIVLPLEACHYFSEPAKENPARYVRASMAIPFFFEPYEFDLKAKKEEHCPYCKELLTGGFHRKVSRAGKLIDGGSLSNFPISLFHQDHIKEPRIPIMGVRIQDTEPVMTNLSSKKTTFGGYLGMIINTVRNNEDNTFLSINPFYQKNCIAYIKTYPSGISWLNFDLSREQKEELFLIGVRAAVNFLKKFDWQEYKKERKNL